MAMNLMFLREVERNETLVRVARAPEAQREALISEYQSRWEAAYSPSTLRNYRQSIRLFTAWCTENGHDPQPPISPSVLALYVDYLGGKVRASTIINRLTAIGEHHRAHFHVSPARHRLVELAVRSVKRKYGCALRQAPALGKKEVLQILSRMGATRKDIRDKALLWVASDSWCRASELVAFKVRDLVRQDDGSSLLFVTRSKTDPFGEGAYSYLSRRGTNAVLDWIRLAGLKADEPIFIKSWKNGRRQAIHPSSVSRIFKKHAGRDDVSAHSTRVGGVQDAFRLGCDLSSIMVAGRWMSPEMPAKYGRRILASQSAAAQVCAAFEASDATPHEMQMINEDTPDKASVPHAAIREFLAVNRRELASDPALAAERLDCFLDKLRSIPEEDCQKIRRQILGGLKLSP
jgi:site-specific recombinase XerD